MAASGEVTMGGQNARISKHSAAGRVGGDRGGRMGEERRVHIKTRTHQQESGGNKKSTVYQDSGRFFPVGFSGCDL